MLADVLSTMRENNAYVDVHTTQFPEGELRAQLKSRKKNQDKDDDGDDSESEKRGKGHDKNGDRHRGHDDEVEEIVGEQNNQ